MSEYDTHASRNAGYEVPDPRPATGQEIEAIRVRLARFRAEMDRLTERTRRAAAAAAGSSSSTEESIAVVGALVLAYFRETLPQVSVLADRTPEAAETYARWIARLNSSVGNEPLRGYSRTLHGEMFTLFRSAGPG